MRVNPSIALFTVYLEELNVAFVLEYKFHPSRRWRFDFALPQYKLAIEVEGGTYSGGRHVRGSGFEADCEKYNTAITLGWHVLRFTTSMVMDGRAKETVKAFLRTVNVKATGDQHALR